MDVKREKKVNDVSYPVSHLANAVIRFVLGFFFVSRKMNQFSALFDDFVCVPGGQ